MEKDNYHLTPKCEACNRHLTRGEYRFCEYVKRPPGRPYICYHCRMKQIEQVKKNYELRIKNQNL
jgi:hypothetical protein